jgi:hypothetical protein
MALFMRVVPPTPASTPFNDDIILPGEHTSTGRQLEDNCSDIIFCQEVERKLTDLVIVRRRKIL